MKNIYGFIAEFNPFHYGHKLFIDKIQQQYHPDVLIAVMSGNYVQRGDFAILDKWNRTQLALQSGVDLVIELPFAYAVEPANLFSQGAMKLLNELKVNNLVFGTENELDFTKLAKQILSFNDDFDQNYNNSYAQNLNDHLEKLGVTDLNQPNQLLGINYVQEIVKNNYDITVNTVLRNRSDYSATQIRRNLLESKSIHNLVPTQTLGEIIANKIISWDDLYPYLKYRILDDSLDELRNTYQMVEGLEYKFKKEIAKQDNFEAFLSAIKSKRYTRSRLRRLSMYTLMNVKNSEIATAYNEPYLRVLGFNELGKDYLKELRKQDVSFITKVGKKENETMALELKVDSVRKLIDNKEENFGRIPLMEGVN